jgi:hypothetical protein
MLVGQLYRLNDKIKKILPSYLEKQPNFSFPCNPRNNPLG